MFRIYEIAFSIDHNEKKSSEACGHSISKFSQDFQGCYDLQGPDIMHHKQGLQKVLELLRLGEGNGQSVTAVGHRVVHGGEALTQPSLVTESVKHAIEKAIPLAPLHNPPNLEVQS